MFGVISIDESVPGDYPALPPGRWPDTAVSSEAESVGEATDEVVAAFECSEALFGEKAAVISELDAIADECREENWDGEGASSIHSRAVSTAVDFVRVMPEGVPLPECAPEPDGSISLDWIVSPRRVLSVSVGANPRLAYAWLDGTDKGHGVARFDGETIPNRILQNIRIIMNHAKNPIRAA